MSNETLLFLSQRKSVGVGVLLTLLFGGFGVFYASVVGGAILSALQVLFFVIALLTLGLGGILFIPLWIVALIVTCVAIEGHNKRLAAALRPQA
jgi:hypothetical protein